jgi:hypothetical protein
MQDIINQLLDNHLVVAIITFVIRLVVAVLLLIPAINIFGSRPSNTSSFESVGGTFGFGGCDHGGHGDCGGHGGSCH